MDPVTGTEMDDAFEKIARKAKKPKKKTSKRKPAKKTKKAKRSAKKKVPKRKTAKRPAKTKGGVVARSERLDMRLTKAEKAKVVAKAKKTRRTVTSLIIEAIEKIR